MMPKTTKKNSIITSVLPSSGKERSMIETNLRILGSLLTDLKGLITLMDLR